MDVREKLTHILTSEPEMLKNLNVSTIKLYRLVDKLIANGVTVQEWISVKDRLPENMDDRVLVLLPTKSYDYPIGNQHIDTDRYRGEYRKWVRYGDKVTNWMPLPQPPKGE